MAGGSFSHGVRELPLRVSQAEIDKEPGDGHSSLEVHQALGDNEFSVLEETEVCVSERRGAQKIREARGLGRPAEKV